MSTHEGKGLLEGLRVVEFAQVVAGPLAGGLLADQGATVVHVESPRGGDPARVMGPQRDGVHLWWKVCGRNKRSVSIDLRQPEGQELAHDLARWADVVVLGLRPKTLREWTIDRESLHAVNPRLIVLQLSGYGATSSLADEPGLGKMGEARSGVVHLTGEKDGRPIHTGFSHGDAVAGLMGSHAVLAALYRRSVDPDFSGEWIDLALFEPLFRLVEWQVIVHDQLGTIPNRAGNQLAVAPAAVVNTYRTSEGEWVTVTTATRRSVRQVSELVGMTSEDCESLADEAALRDALDRRLQDWVAARPTTTALAELAAHEVVASRIFHMGDIARDSTYTEREDIITVPDPDLGPVRMQAVIPHAHHHPGGVWRTGPQLGQDTALVLGEWLGIGEDRRRALASRRVILEQVSAGT